MESTQNIKNQEFNLYNSNNLNNFDNFDSKNQNKSKKYSTKKLWSFSSVSPWFIFPFSPYTFVNTWKLIIAIIKDFFLLQALHKLHLTHHPVIYVDTDLDDKIPFVPEKVKDYMSFIPFFIKPTTMLRKRLGMKKAGPYISIFLRFIATMYHNAASIYRFCMTTTHRPKYIQTKEFRAIHIADPHLLCVPSLHVTIAAGTYAWFKQLFKTGILPQEEAQKRLDEIYTQAMKITESVLFVKQHSVNCIPLALYMLTSTMNKSFFSIEDAADFMNDLFKNCPEISEDLRKEIVNYFEFMYEKSLLENIYSKNWQDCIKNWLIDYAKKTGQELKINK